MGDKPSVFQRLKVRWKQVLEEYGAVALVTWFAVFFSTIFAFGMAIDAGLSPAEVLERIGMDPSRADSIGTAGKWGLAYGLTQLTKPARIAIVLVLTPIVAKAWHKVTGKPGPLEAPLPSEHDDAAEAQP